MVVEKALPNDNQACHSCWRLMPVGLSRNGVLQNSSHKSFTGVLIKIVSGLLKYFLISYVMAFFIVYNSFFLLKVALILFLVVSLHNRLWQLGGCDFGWWLVLQTFWRTQTPSVNLLTIIPLKLKPFALLPQLSNIIANR